MADVGKDKVEGDPMGDEAIPQAVDSVQDGSVASPEEQIAGETDR